MTKSALLLSAAAFALAGFAAGGQYSSDLPSEGMDDARGGNTAAAGLFGLGQNVAAVFEHQAVDGDGPLDGGIDGKCDDQVLTF